MTEFAICRDKDLIAIGAADASVSILDEATLRPLRRMQKVNGFPASGLFFVDEWAVSTAADATCAMVEAGDLGSFNALGYVKALLKLVLLALVLGALVVVALVVKGVSGAEARDEGLVEGLLSSRRAPDLANLDPQKMLKFVTDYFVQQH